MSQTERTYGNTSRMEGVIRSRFTSSHMNATYGKDNNIVPIDCVTCQKNTTGKIPKDKKCKLICG